MEATKWKEFQSKMKQGGCCTNYAATQMLVKEYVKQERKREEGEKTLTRVTSREQLASESKGGAGVFSSMAKIAMAKMDGELDDTDSTHTASSSFHASNNLAPRKRPSFEEHDSEVPPTKTKPGLRRNMAKRHSTSLASCRLLGSRLARFDEEEDAAVSHRTGEKHAPTPSKRSSFSIFQLVDDSPSEETKATNARKDAFKSMVTGVVDGYEMQSSAGSSMLKSQSSLSLSSSNNRRASRASLEGITDMRGLSQYLSTFVDDSDSEEEGDSPPEDPVLVGQNRDRKNKFGRFATSLKNNLSKSYSTFTTEQSNSNCSLPVEIVTDGTIKRFSVKESEILVDFPARGSNCDTGDLINHHGQDANADEKEVFVKPANWIDDDEDTDVEEEVYVKPVNWIDHDGDSDDEAEVFVKPSNWIEHDDDTDDENEGFVKPANWIDNEGSDEEEEKQYSSEDFLKAADLARRDLIKESLSNTCDTPNRCLSGEITGSSKRRQLLSQELLNSL